MTVADGRNFRLTESVDALPALGLPVLFALFALVWSAVAAPNNFAIMPGTAPTVTAASIEDRVILQLMLIPYVPGHNDRIALMQHLDGLVLQGKLAKVRDQCTAAFRIGMRVREADYEGAAYRQMTLTPKCMKSVEALMKKANLTDRKGPMVEALFDAKSLPRYAFNNSACHLSADAALLALPGPESARMLTRPEGGESPYAAMVVAVTERGAATVLAGLEGDEASLKQCWASVEGQWRPSTNTQTGETGKFCAVHRCEFP